MLNSKVTNVISICNPVVSNIGSIKTFFFKNGIKYILVNIGDKITTKSLLICGVSGLYFTDPKSFSIFNDWIQNVKNQNKQIVGICAGMQMLFSQTEEVNQKMLNLVPGRVKKLIFNNPKINTYIGKRHIHYNNLYLQPYFSHGYGVIEDDISIFDEYIEVNSNEMEKFVAFFSYGNILGFQFHPERSCENTMNFFIDKLLLGYES